MEKEWKSSTRQKGNLKIDIFFYAFLNIALLVLLNDYLTYFINTNNTNSFNVIATAEDSTAKVCIVGNDNIQSGNNKILISVTAENGNIRYYRIFVNCE